jgi:GntR family transcriptional repressor for pyruvate dehydrogenase complex
MTEFAPVATRRRPVPDAAEALRELVFAAEPDSRIGSLPDLARQLGVGISTVQQAARVLEHEGLLAVRRGPGGGYYGQRPDAAALERTFSAYMRMHPASYEEALDMTSLLFTELASAAADCRNDALQAELASMLQRIVPGAAAEDRLVFESMFQDLLFRMVDRPLFEMLTRVTLHFSEIRAGPAVIMRSDQAEQWWLGRRAIISAILEGDAELARFEADRCNRRIVMKLQRTLVATAGACQIAPEG